METSGVLETPEVCLPLCYFFSYPFFAISAKESCRAGYNW